MAEFLPDAIIERLRSAEAVTVLTGAGISAESGIPTFRSAQHRPLAQLRPDRTSHAPSVYA